MAMNRTHATTTNSVTIQPSMAARVHERPAITAPNARRLATASNASAARYRPASATGAESRRSVSISAAMDRNANTAEARRRTTTGQVRRGSIILRRDYAAA
jgi:hypothetical protein